MKIVQIHNPWAKGKAKQQKDRRYMAGVGKIKKSMLTGMPAPAVTRPRPCSHVYIPYVLFNNILAFPCGVSLSGKTIKPLSGDVRKQGK